MIHDVRVIFGDTDMMGVVYYANYLRYFESARAAWLRDLVVANVDGLSLGLPVIESYCRYRKPARYNDLLRVHLVVAELTQARVRFDYEIRREQDVLAEGFTVHASVNSSTGKPQRLPNELYKALQHEMTPEETV